MWTSTGGLVELEIVNVTDTGDVQARGHLNADGSYADLPTQDLRMFEPYGLHARPLKGTAGVYAEMQSDDLAVVGYQPAIRPTLSQNGQVHLTDYSGQSIDLIPGTGLVRKCIGSKLGTSTAAEAMALATTMQTDLNVFLSAASGWSKELNTLKGAGAAGVVAYATTMEGYVNTLISAIISWVSNRHFLDQ